MNRITITRADCVQGATATVTRRRLLRPARSERFVCMGTGPLGVAHWVNTDTGEPACHETQWRLNVEAQAFVHAARTQR